MTRTSTPISGLAASLAIGLAMPSTAAACGGFFCSQVPIDQSKERILFAIDEEEGKVEAHVQIFYQGSAEEFAWVVPIPKQPEVGLSSDELFNQLEWRTVPQFRLSYAEEGTCEYDSYGFDEARNASTDAVPPAAEADPSADVVVVDKGQVGPYEQVTLQATSTDALLTWLNDNQYVIPENVTDALAPYIAEGAYVLALRLQSDRDVGDIAPVKFRYDGTAGAIPLVLTSIAATPDMRLQPYILADHRAVPQGYLHVQVNEAAINWFSGGANYDDVITQAANEAGGQAFATDYAGSTEQMQDMLLRGQTIDLATMRQTDNPAQYINLMLNQAIPSNASVQNLIRQHMPMPQSAIAAGIDESSFYNCLECYPEHMEQISFDPEAMTDDLDTLIVTPMVEADALFDKHPYITRMTSSMSPDEMTEDPIFVLNKEMEDVSNIHDATFVLECGDGLLTSQAPGRIELADGREIRVPPQQWMQDNDYTYGDLATELGSTAAEIIESTSSDAAPVLLSDNSELVDQAIAEHNARVLGSLPGTSSSAGCGCRTTGASSSASVVILALLGMVARRRRD